MTPMKKVLVGAALGASTLAGVAQAEWSANVGVSSSYLFRGIQFSDDAQVFGGIDYAHGSGWYAGSWVSNTSGNDELDLYTGFSGAISDALSYDLGVIAYLFPSDPELSVQCPPPSLSNTPSDRSHCDTPSHGNSTELYAGLAGAWWSTTLWYNFGFDNVEDDEFVHLEGNVEFPIRGRVSLALNAGYTVGTGDAYDAMNIGDQDDDYINYGVTVNVDTGSGTFSLGVSNTNIDQNNVWSGAGVISDGEDYGQERPVFWVGLSRDFADIGKRAN